MFALLWLNSWWALSWPLVAFILNLLSVLLGILCQFDSYFSAPIDGENYQAAKLYWSLFLQLLTICPPQTLYCIQTKASNQGNLPTKATYQPTKASNQGNWPTKATYQPTKASNQGNWPTKATYQPTKASNQGNWPTKATYQPTKASNQGNWPTKATYQPTKASNQGNWPTKATYQPTKASNQGNWPTKATYQPTNRPFFFLLQALLQFLVSPLSITQEEELLYIVPSCQLRVVPHQNNWEENNVGVLNIISDFAPVRLMELLCVLEIAAACSRICDPVFGVFIYYGYLELTPFLRLTEAYWANLNSLAFSSPNTPNLQHHAIQTVTPLHPKTKPSFFGKHPKLIRKAQAGNPSFPLLEKLLFRHKLKTMTKDFSQGLSTLQARQLARDHDLHLGCAAWAMLDEIWAHSNKKEVVSQRILPFFTIFWRYFILFHHLPILSFTLKTPNATGSRHMIPQSRGEKAIDHKPSRHGARWAEAPSSLE